MKMKQSHLKFLKFDDTVPHSTTETQDLKYGSSNSKVLKNAFELTGKVVSNFKNDSCIHS